jgi:uncharacterized repeat protein (TIGR03803 family)
MHKAGLRTHLLVALVAVVTSLFAQAQTYTFSTLYSFKNSGDGPHLPMASLIIDNAGNLYGVASGGEYNNGTVFKVTSAGTMTVLYSFKGDQAQDGRGSAASLFMDPAGNLYGTTFVGGIPGDCPDNPLAQGCGTVFKLTPAGEETVLYRFQGLNDGSLPQAGVVVDSDGNVYGTTLNYYEFLDGGDGGNGNVYKIDASGTFSIFHLFCSQDPNCPDGQYPVSAPILDAAGNLYGSTASGGAYDAGIIYQFTPDGTETVISSLAYEYESLVQGNLNRDSEGNFYGVTYAEAFNTTDGGKIFKVTPDGQETVPYSFCIYSPPGCTAGDYPVAPIQIDKAGNLYGVVTLGGANGSGGVFEVNTSGAETILYNFPSGVRSNGLVMDSEGNLYGASVNGGAYGLGSVYKLTLQK